MTSTQPRKGEDEASSKSLQTALRTTFSASIKQHLQRCIFAIPPIILIHRQAASLNPFLRFLTTMTATMYYPVVCFVTSLSLSPLLFLQRQTNTLQALLSGLLDTMVLPLRHIKSPTLGKVSDTMTAKSDEMLEKEKRGGRRFVLWMLIKVVRKALDLRFGEVLKEEGLTAESLGKVAGRELIGLVLGPVQNSLMMAIAGVGVSAALFGAAPFVLLRVFRK